MNIKSKFAIVAALASSVIVTTIVPAAAITDTVFKYSSPKNGILTISTMDFAPDGSATSGNAWFNSWSSNSLTGSGCFNTGFNLPQGAKITQFRVLYSKGIDAHMIAINQANGAFSYLAQIHRNNGNSARTGFNAAIDPPHTVLNSKYQYGIGVCIDPGETFNGVRILYTYDNAGD